MFPTCWKGTACPWPLMEMAEEPTGGDCGGCHSDTEGHVPPSAPRCFPQLHRQVAAFPVPLLPIDLILENSWFEMLIIKENCSIIYADYLAVQNNVLLQKISEVSQAFSPV